MRSLVGFGHARAKPAGTCCRLSSRQAAVKRMLAIVSSCVAVCLYGVRLWMEKFVQDWAQIGIGRCYSDELLSRLNRRREKHGGLLRCQSCAAASTQAAWSEFFGWNQIGRAHV